MGHKPLEDVLEILLITHNRSKCLDNTLSQLKGSPFARCKFTVLDNCSIDDTPNVIQRYFNEFPDFHVVRHPRNIGGDYNYLRAIELSTSYYTWVICDDDNFDFTFSEEIVTEIEMCKYDLIYTLSPEKLRWKSHGETTVRQLTSGGARYHGACAFWPSLIFKSELFDHCCYANSPYSLPSMRFINKSLVDNFSIYIPEHAVVIRSEGAAANQRPLIEYKAWVENAVLIDDHELRRYVIEQWTDKGFLRTLAFWIAVDRTCRAKGYWKCLVDIMFAFTPRQRLKFLLLLPIVIIPLPMSILICAREIVYRIMGHKDIENLPPINNSLPH